MGAPTGVTALLLVNAGKSVSVDRMIDELWGEWPPATAQHAVQVYLSGVRKVLSASGDDLKLRGSAAGYRLDVDPERVDARRFERLIGRPGTWRAMILRAPGRYSMRRLASGAVRRWLSSPSTGSLPGRRIGWSGALQRWRGRWRPVLRAASSRRQSAC